MNTESLTADFRQLVTGICQHPQDLVIAENSSPNTVHTMVVRPHMADLPILCGKAGRQINALKYLAKLIGFELDLQESFVGDREPRTPFEPRPNLDTRPVVELISRIAAAALRRVPAVRAIRNEDKLFIWIRTDPTQADETPIVMALASAFHPYGYRIGCLIDIRAERSCLACATH